MMTPSRPSSPLRPYPFPGQPPRSRRRRKKSYTRFFRRLRALVFASLVASFGFAMLKPAVSFGNPSPRPLVELDMATEFQAMPGVDNIRSGAAQAGDIGEILYEDSVDGVPWYYIRLTDKSERGWVQGDRLNARTIPAPEPGTTVFATTGDDTVSYNPAVNSPATPGVSPFSISEAVESYFMEVAMSSEWGDSGGVVRKWTGPVRVGVLGNPTQDDMQTLRQVIGELNELITDEQVTISLDDRNPNVVMRFIPEAQFRSVEPNYRPRNLGFFWLQWNNRGLSNARILISTTGVNQRERSHLIREELTQVMGLMSDSYTHADSIFYQRWTDVNAYAPIDRDVIRLLYQPSITYGMSRREVAAEIAQLRRSPAVATQPANSRW